MAPLGVGIIGLSADPSAWATAAHVSPLKSPPLNKEYKLVAVGTSSPESAKKSAEAHGLPADKAYSSPEAIASDKDVDLVVVSVKIPFHKQLALPALNAKKDVFVEWPLANGLQEAEELAALAKKQGVRTAIGLQARFHPSVQKAKEIITSGALGRITATTVVASTSHFVNLSSKNRYVNDPKNGANLVTIPTIHILDPLLYLLGEFKSLSATTATTQPELIFLEADGSRSGPVKSTLADFISIAGVLKSGAGINYVLSSNTKATPDHIAWIISGEQGSLKFEGPSGFFAMVSPSLSQSTAKAEGKWEEVEVPKAAFGGIGVVYEAFAQGNKDVVDFDAALQRHQLVEAIERSAKNGTREVF